MADQPVKNSEIRQEDYSWILYFSFSSWLILSLIFFTGVYKSIILSADKHYAPTKDSQKITRVIIDQELINKTPSPDKKYFVGDKNNEASGKITEQKGFESMSPSDELKFSKGSQNQKNTPEKTVQNEQETGNQFYAKIIHSLKDAFSKEKPAAQTSQSAQVAQKPSRESIPGNYEFKKEFVFSWDRNGMPVIPTVFEKNYKYFKHILDDIQSNWAPPGGMPYPTFDTSFNAQAYIPGRNTYQAFPDQDVQVVFSISSNGDVVETKLWKSMGFQSLDRACLDAIIKSKNFGPPPADLLDNNQVFVMPLTFRIIGNR